MGFFKSAHANKERTPPCSFCGKSRDKVPKMFAGPRVFICSECITICNEIILDDAEMKSLQPELFEMPPPPKTSYDLQCSFCGKSQDEVQKLIAGPMVYICNECIDVCNEIIRDDGQTTLSPQALTHPARIGGIICPLCQRLVPDFTLIPDRGPLCAQCLEAIKAVLDGSEHKV